MDGLQHVTLAHRALIAIGGEDRVAFLQGLVSNDVTRAAPAHVVWSAFLTPQGKFLHEFFLGDIDGELFLEAEAERRADLMKRLGMYRLRSKVAIRAVDDLAVHAVIGTGAARAFDLPAEPGAARPLAGGRLFVDPRLAAGGLRAWLPPAAAATLREAGAAEADAGAWDRWRLTLGLPDGSRDLVVEKSILLENGFDEMHGVDWKKGCYMGQELTARTRYRGLVKKRLTPVSIDGPAPEPGSPVMLGENEAGEMRSHAGDLGLALLRLEILEQLAADGGNLRAGEAVLTPRQPAWLA
ncbi:MAG TPA: folate-binding protein YgfZ [Rhodospirillaceae bacterium]|nr:folate-binding protein YgfZ [Rhodospirillaceae bacterium]